MFIRSGYSAQTRSVRPASGTQHHHRRADVVVGLGDRARGLDAQPGIGALGLERRGLEAVEADDVLLDGPPARGVDGLADATDHGAVRLLADADRAAGVDDAVDLADVGQRRQAADLVERLERVGDRDREQPAVGEVRAGAAQERRAAGGAAEELDRLHRHEDQREAPAAEVELARVGRDRLDRQPDRPRAQRGEQRRRAVERDDRVPARREVQGDTAGAGADVEHRAGLPSGELAPQRQVLGIAGALDIVPDDLGHMRARARGHAKLLPAAPRATSTSRSASIAVYVGSANSRPSPSPSARSRPSSSAGAIAIRAGSTPAYFSRSAISAARVPLHVTCRTRPARTSKSASQTQLTSRPWATLSLRIASRSCSPGSSGSVRRTSLAPAGFWTSRTDRSRPPSRTVSARPNAGETASSPAATSSSEAPSAMASAAAPSAL